MENKKSVVSVIVTTRNEERNIANCLESVKDQSYPAENIEIIVVDNNSIDRTKSFSETYTKSVYNYGPERAAQRNFGVSKAKGEYILYLDADMVLSPDVIAECLEKCEKERLLALYIPERIIGRGFWARVRDFERSFYNATSIDCVRFVKRDKFLEIGGFDEGLTGPEDWDFDRRIARLGSVGIIVSPLYHHEGEFNLKKYLCKKSYYAQWFDKYIQKWGKDDIIIRKQLGFWYRYIGVFLEGGKWKIIFRHPLLTCAMYSLRIILGLNYLAENVLSKGREELS